METGYIRLVSKEFVDICVICNGADRIGLQRAIDQGQRTIAVLESNGMSTKGIPIVKQEIRDYFNKPREVNYCGLIDNPQCVKTENPRISFDPEIYQDYRDELGREMLPIIIKKFNIPCNDFKIKKLLEN